MSKKLIFFANSRYPVGFANAVNVFRMASAFSSQGYDVTLVALRTNIGCQKTMWKETCRRFGVFPLVKPRLLWYPFYKGAEVRIGAAALFYLLFEKKETLVYTRVLYAAFFALLFGFKTVYESHNPPKGGLKVKIVKWMFSNPRLLTVMISKGLKKEFEKLKLIPANFLIAHDAGRLLKKTAPVEREFTGRCENIGYIGSLFAGRGFEVIVKLGKEMPDRKFHLFGDINTLSDKNSDIPSNIILYDRVTPDQAEKILQLFDALLMPYQKVVKVRNAMDTSLWMSPMKMFEYMLSGKPVISSDHEVLREVLKDGENSLLVSGDDIDAWTNAIKKLDSHELRYKLARQAYIEAAEEYTWDVRAKRIIKKMEAVC